MAWLTTDETAIVKKLIDDLEKNPKLLYQSHLQFLKKYIEGLGGIIPIGNDNLDQTGGNDDDTGYYSRNFNDTEVVACEESNENITKDSKIMVSSYEKCNSPKRIVAVASESYIDRSNESAEGRGKRRKIPKMCGLCREPLCQPPKKKKFK